MELYLKDFKGCVIIISHDRYFMDKVVDHLFVFKGGGEVKDFPGNYTQYRSLTPDPSPGRGENNQSSQNTQNTPRTQNNQERKRKLTFREKQEFEALGK